VTGTDVSLSCDRTDASQGAGKTYPVEPLTCRAVAVFAGQRLVPAQLVLDLAAMALALPLDVELVTVLVDSVGCSELPLILLPMGRVAGLVLMGVGAIAAVLFVIRHLLLLFVMLR
jgi:hypothetical protein